MCKCMKALIPLTLILVACTSRIPGDWDVYEGGNTGLEIEDSTSVGAGVVINNATGEFVDSMAIEITIEHGAPATLLITLSHDSDTVALYDHDYPGGTQLFNVDTFVGQPVNGEWMVHVSDYVVDSHEGWLNEFRLLIRYRE